MPRIHILPEILSNKIAAGEVVERPASVVKELVENAIDAESAKITIEIERGGRSLIRVSDNGTGMSHDDALLAVERHATSKIRTDADLYAIRTLGFRGEALPSIASVSKFTLITRERESLSGTEIQMEAGRVKNVMDAGAPPGTMISVAQLFFNVPARRKFLKTEATEMGHIAETVTGQALARPSIHFRLTHNNREILNWPAGEPLFRALAVLGEESAALLPPVNVKEGDTGLSGWISDPSVTRSTPQKIYLFVNGRRIHDRGLQYALFEGYRGRLMKGRFPLAALFLTLPPDQVDVNVHPAKHEVRFADASKIYGLVRKAAAGVWAAPRQPAKMVRETSGPVVWEASPSTHPHEVQEAPPPFFPPPPWETDDGPPPAPSTEIAPDPRPTGSAPFSSPAPSRPLQPGLWESPTLADARIIGQFNNTYILCEGNQELLVVDQHAAHERIYYETLKKNREAYHPEACQRLILPETFELGFSETAAICPMLPDLRRLGLEIEHFGGNTFVVRAVPPLLADRELRPLIVEIAETVCDRGTSPGLPAVMDQCLILMACHGAIRARQSLTIPEMKALLARLDACDNPLQCPHGRPIVIRWPVAMLEKQFKRVL